MALTVTMKAGGRGIRVALVVILLAAAAALVSPAPAGAQASDCPPPDPYSGGQSCPNPPTCHLDQQVIEAGARMRVQASGFGTGDELTGTFDGTEVFKQHTVDGSLDVTFTIPQRPPGDYALVVTGSPSGQQCDPGVHVSAGAEVLGTQFTRGDTSGSASGTASGTSTGSSGSTSGTRTFARTGVEIGLLVLLGALLVLVGRRLRRSARPDPA